jgi:hypothetical protein
MLEVEAVSQSCIPYVQIVLSIFLIMRLKWTDISSKLLGFHTAVYM